jgi:hypothetical protein
VHKICSNSSIGQLTILEMCLSRQWRLTGQRLKNLAILGGKGRLRFSKTWWVRFPPFS